MSDFDLGPNVGLIGRTESRAEIETPALVLDVDRLDKNIRTLAEHASTNGYLIRACGKIHKSVEIARRQVQAGAVGVCCATLREAEAFVAGGIRGVMLFTSVVSEAKLNRLAALNARAQDLIVVIDSSNNVEQIGNAVRKTGKTLQVMVDFELGGRRTGVASAAEVVALARQISNEGCLEFVGIQGYNGRGLALPDFDARRKIQLDRLSQLSKLVEILDAEGLHPRIVSGGGTGSHDIDPEAQVFTEIQAGTYVFMDLYYKETAMRRGEPHPFEHALSVRGSVISAAQKGFVITDVGVKEVDGANTQLSPTLISGAPDGANYSLVGDDLGRIDFLNDDDRLPVGSAIELLPPHCYQTVDLHSVYHCVKGNTLVDIWPIDAAGNW